MKTVDELLTVVQTEYQAQNQRAVQLYGTLQSIDGYDMGGNFKLLSNDGLISIVKDGEKNRLAEVYWETNQAMAVLGASDLETAFSSVVLTVKILGCSLTIEKKNVPLEGLVVSFFKTKQFERNSLDAAAEYLFAYIAAVKQKICAR